MNITNILVPFDFSEPSRAAVRYAAALAGHFNSAITLLHVNQHWMPPVSGLEMIPVPVGPEWVEEAETQLSKALDGFRPEELKHSRVERIVVTGDPAQQIVTTAEETGADLIVMPTHGYGPFRQFLLGSVTSKVLHDAPCPVWTSAHMEEQSSHHWQPMRQVICAVDLKPGSRQVVDWAVAFSKEFGALLSLVHALPALDSPDDMLSKEIREKQIAACRHLVEQLLDQDHAGAEIYIEEGDPDKAVHRVADETGADLVVVGRGAEGSGRLGSHAYAVIRHAPCPVVSI